MSSILTNNSAMVALSTLRSTNKSLTDVQSQISTGKKVSSAKDNAAVWAISSVMNSDVSALKTVNDGLALGQSTVAVASTATDKIKEMLTSMKQSITSTGASANAADRQKIQADIDNYKEQITSFVSAAQFNGVNLLQGTGTVDVLSSLNRSAAGQVSTSNISIQKQNLEETASTAGTTGIPGSNTAAATDPSALAAATTVVAGTPLDIGVGDGSTGNAVTAGATITFGFTNSAGVAKSYTVGAGTANTLATNDAAGLATAMQAALTADSQTDFAVTTNGAGTSTTLRLTRATGETSSITDFHIDSDNKAATNFGAVIAGTGVGGSQVLNNKTVAGGTRTAVTGSTSIGTANADAVTAGAVYKTTINDGSKDYSFSYTVQAGDQASDVAAGLTAAYAALSTANKPANLTLTQGAAGNAYKINLSSTNGTDAFTSKTTVTGIDATVSNTSIAGVTAGGVKSTETVKFQGKTVAEGDTYNLTVGSDTFSYVAHKGDTLNTVGQNLAGLAQTGTTHDVNITVDEMTDPTDSSKSMTFSITNNESSAVALNGAQKTGGKAGGGMEELASIDVSSEEKKQGSLKLVENLLNRTINAGASFGSASKKLTDQSDFVTSLTSSLTSGVGSLVDANMEETAARLQALQVQQQLGTQALSIANQAPQSILSLFR
jgi:flagellin